MEKEKNKCPHCLKKCYPDEGLETIYRCTGGCGAVLDVEDLV